MTAIKNQKIKLPLTKIAIFMLLLYSFTIPLAVHIYPSVVIKYITLLLAAGLFCAAMLKKLKDFYIKITPTEAFMFFLGFFVTIENYELKIGGYYYVISYWVLWIVAVASKYNDQWQTTILNLSCIFSMVYAVATIVAYLSESIYLNYMLPLLSQYNTTRLIRLYNEGYMLGLTEHYSTNGMYLAIGTGAFFSKLVPDFNKKQNWICLLVVIFALLLTGKRGPLLFAIGAIVVVLYFYKSDKPNGRILKILAVVAAGIIAVLIASIWVPNIMNAIDRFASTSDDGDVTAGRGPLFALAIKLFKQKPLLGWGWGSYPYLYYEVYGKYQYVAPQRHAHNIYLQLLCEVGVVGLVVFVIFFVWQLYRVLKLYKDYRKGLIILPDSVSAVLPFAVYSQVFFLMYGMTGNPLYDVMVLFPYLLSCITVNYYTSKRYSTSNRITFIISRLMPKRKKRIRFTIH